MTPYRTLPLIAAFVLASAVGAQPFTNGCHYFRNKGVVHRELTASERDQINETIARSDTFDIRHYDIDIDVTDYDGHVIKASTTVTFRALMAGQPYIRFDLLALTVDSVIGPSGPMGFTHDNAFLKVDFETVPAVGVDQQITVHYHGTPHRDPEWGGFYFESNYIYNLGIGISTIPPNFGKVWYPCFDSFVERATYTYHVKSAGAYRLHGQGTFLGELQLGGDTVVRSYDMAQEIPTHLSAIAVADYRDSTWVHSGANGDIPVTLTAKPANLNAMASRFGDIGAAIDACEYWYGPYAYGRVGYVHTTDGALEIPTNVAYPEFMSSQSVANNRKLFTHELGHHWWGDVVAPYVHNDMWLKEGPAEYSAHLIEEWLNGHDAFVQVVKSNLLNILSGAHIDDGGFQPLSPMPDAYIYGTHTYNKGAAVMHNLRGYLGDELFRTAMHDVQSQHANTALTAVGFKEALEASTGQDLDPFFNAWVFAPGYSVFEVRNWDHAPGAGGEDVHLDIGQKLYGATVLHEQVPLELTMVGANGEVFDTMVQAGGALSSVDVQCPFVPEMVVLDRYHKLNQARMDHEITLVPGVSFNNSLPWVDFRLFQNTLTDTTLVRVDHIWSGADQAPLGAGLTDISTTHYWNVDGVWPEGTSLSGRLFYFGGAASQFDFELIAGDETGIVVAHRATADAPWQVYPDQTVNTGSTTNGTGTITMNTLAKGQYAFAKMIGSIGMPEREGGAFRLYPVPAADHLTVELDEPQEDFLLLDVLGTDGRLVQRTTLAGGSGRVSLGVSGLAPGSYLLRIAKASGGTVGARSFQVVR